MKAVILEKRNGSAAVLKEDGTIVKMRTELPVGATVELPERRSGFLFSRHALAAAMAVVLCVSLGFGWNFMAVQAYSYVSVDVNPSIEYTLNRLDRVISVEAVNTEAEEMVSLLAAADLEGCTLSEALTATEQVLTENGWLGTDDYMLVNISTDNETRRQRLEGIVREALTESRPEYLIITESTLNTRQTAREAGVSAGRYEELQKTGMEARDLPVNDLLRESGQIPDHAGIPDEARSDNGQMPENREENHPGETVPQEPQTPAEAPGQQPAEPSGREPVQP